MPLGRPAHRIAPVVTAALFAASAGCNALPWSSRLPEAAEVKTRIEGDHPDATRAPRAVRPTADRHETPAPVVEESPLPPAIDRPAPAAAATPLLDEALVRADARTKDLVDALARDDTPAPTPPATTPAPNHPAAEAPRPAETKPEPAPPAPPAAQAPAVAPPVTTAPAPEPKTTEESWREGVQTLRSVVRDRLHAAKDPRPGAPNWVVRERLLAWLAEPDIDPDARSSGEIAQGRAVLKGLAALLDPSAPAPARGAEIREAVAALEAEAPLEITELKPCRVVHGFGSIEPLEPAVRKPGQAIILYCEINGLAYEPAGPAFRSRVEARVELFRDGTDAPAWTHALPAVEDACRKRRRDYFIGHKFTLPEGLAPGNYRLRLTQKDLVADHVASRETTIAVVK